MASLVRPRCFQTEEELNTVRCLLGWSSQETAWGIQAGSVPLGDLRAGEFVLFISHISTGLGLPISSSATSYWKISASSFNTSCRTPSS